MQKKSVFAMMAAISCVVAASGVWVGAATAVPATATFRDLDTDRILSDKLYIPASYYHGIDCVRSQVGQAGAGGFGFRSRIYGCTAAAFRSVTLDFSHPVVAGCTSPTYVADAYAGGQLNICGSNLVPDVRINAGSMFASSALSRGTPVILVFSTPASYTGPGGFELDFEQNVGVTATSSALTRVLTAPATAIAELYQNLPSSGKKVSLGRYYMPFSLTVAKDY